MSGSTQAEDSAAAELAVRASYAGQHPDDLVGIAQRAATSASAEVDQQYRQGQAQFEAGLEAARDTPQWAPAVHLAFWYVLDQELPRAALEAEHEYLCGLAPGRALQRLSDCVAALPADGRALGVGRREAACVVRFVRELARRADAPARASLGCLLEAFERRVARARGKTKDVAVALACDALAGGVRLGSLWHAARLARAEVEAFRGLALVACALRRFVLAREKYDPHPLA